jgi:hypothetical protein
MTKDEISLLISALHMSKDYISLLCKCNNTVLLFLLQKKMLLFPLRAKKVLGGGCSSAVPNLSSYNPNSHHPLPPTPPF